MAVSLHVFPTWVTSFFLCCCGVQPGPGWVLTSDGLEQALGEASRTDSRNSSAELAHQGAAASAMAMQVGYQETTPGNVDLMACHTA